MDAEGTLWPFYEAWRDGLEELEEDRKGLKAFTKATGMTPKEADAAWRKYFLENIAITVVRYGGTSLQRTSSRLASMKLHVPSRIYGSREDAIDIIRGLRAGTIALGSEG